jgi:ABC-2 type transport system permease protein
MVKRSKLRSYFAVSEISFRNIRQYTVEFLTSFAYFPAQLIALFFVYSIIYFQAWILNGVTVIGGFSFPQLISYLFIAIIMYHVIPVFRLSIEVEKDIDQGSLVSYLAKPIDYAGFKFFSELPRTLLYLSFGAFTYIITLIFIPLPTPSLVNILLFIPFFYLAYLMAFLLIFTMSLAAFWVSSQWWLRHLFSLSMAIAGGGLIPLSFYPPSIQFILSILPFQYLYSIPAIILQGFYLPELLVPLAIFGTIWLITLYLLSRLIWYRGRHRYEGAGG